MLRCFLRVIPARTILHREAEGAMRRITFGIPGDTDEAGSAAASILSDKKLNFKFVIDASGSIDSNVHGVPQFALYKQHIKDIIKEVTAKVKNWSIELVTFDDNIARRKFDSSERTALLEYIEAMRCGGMTKLNDAILYAL